MGISREIRNVGRKNVGWKKRKEERRVARRKVGKEERMDRRVEKTREG